MSAFNQSGQNVSGGQVNIGGVANTDYRKRIVQEYLDEIRNADPELYEKLMTQSGVAFHFKQLLKMATGEK